ncbi:hypothetical protein LTR12_007490 [Friedmanniomyces endolithicus]|nr:hypothetical protein LTR74_006646 [Friedmanniomyces endolithicus]KAK1818083.1 hypothetical protein LTR12_007490 [Friedmanniomyces endolithicus]
MAHQSRRATRKSPPKVFRLPPEIRGMIWVYVLAESQPINVYPQKRTLSTMAERRCSVKPPWSTSAKVPSFALEPSLANVCRQLRVEVLDTFWAKNTFKLCFIGTDSPALTLARRREKPLIRDVILRFDIKYKIGDRYAVENAPQAAELGLKLETNGKVNFRTMAWLDKECACQLFTEMHEYVQNTREEIACSGLLRLAMDFGPLLCQRYNRNKARWGNACEGCGRKVWTG